MSEIQNKQPKVADVRSEFVIVLNVGIRDGVSLGDKFQIFQLGAPVIDPDTKEELEKIEIVRGSVKVSHIQNTICTAETFTYTDNQSAIKKITRKGSRSMMSLFNEGVTEETEYTKKRDHLVYVEVGDLARKLV